MWRTGQKLVHPFNPELGVGVVMEVDGRFLVAFFPEAERELRLAAEGSGLEPLELRAGMRVRMASTGEEGVLAELSEGRGRLSDGREFDESDLWPLAGLDSPLDRLAEIRLDKVKSLTNRVDGWRLETLRQKSGLAPLLGGRIEHFAHQLHTARRALEDDPVRWLLADEVGLGKTIEACLILSALLRTGRAERALIVAPRTLCVQWLGELYRKFHQVFALMDQERIDAVRDVYEEDANPFEVHPAGVISLEFLLSDTRVADLAREAAPDLIVVDEAHRLVKDEFDSVIAPLVQSSEHALLLTAAPLAADREGFYRLLSLLHSEAYPSFEAFDRDVSKGNATLRCTSAVRRLDLGGFPPRVPVPIDVGPLGGKLGDDPRARFVLDQIPEWQRTNEKALVFVSTVEQAEELTAFLEARARIHVSLFHEDMPTAKRDIEVARFRDTRLPVLVCSEAGGEGRNFQFCRRMLHFDLPDDPVLLEQRIGRLDRIGRTLPVEILYFRPEGLEPDVARLFERLDLFVRPSAGLDVALRGVVAAVKVARESGLDLDVDAVALDVEQERARHTRDLPRSFYPDAYDASQEAEVLAAVPPDLESRTRTFCLKAARQLGLDVIEKGGDALYYVELGAHSKVESLPDVPGGTRYLGTFDRAEAVSREEIEFFASGHSLVEGLLLELADGPRGRAVAFELADTGHTGAGLLVFRQTDAGISTRVVDATGTPQPEWRDAILGSLERARDLRLEPGQVPEGWAERVRELAGDEEGVIAVAFFRLTG